MNNNQSKTNSEKTIISSPIIHSCTYCDAHSRAYSQNDYAFACVSFGALVEGHTIILPKRHVDRFEDLSVKEFTALHTLKKDIITILNKEYGHVFIWENNTDAHPRIHIIPVSEDVAKEFFMQVILNNFQEHSETIPAFLKNNYQTDYRIFSYEHISVTIYGLTPNQYPRKILAKILGRADFDWKKDAENDYYKKTVARFSGAYTKSDNDDSDTNP